MKSALIIFFSIILIGCSNIPFFNASAINDQSKFGATRFLDRKLRIASWNMYNYSKKRGEDAENVSGMIDILMDGGKETFDIIFVQELVSNSDGFHLLCKEIPSTFECESGERFGQDGGFESYGLIYNKTKISDVNLFTADIKKGQGTNEMVRPSLEVELQFRLNNNQYVNLLVLNNHIKPSSNAEKRETVKELTTLERYAASTFSQDPINVIVLGDLNADKPFLPDKLRSSLKFFSSSKWRNLIYERTNFGNKASTFDRIIVNKSVSYAFNKSTSVNGNMVTIDNGASFDPFGNNRYRLGDSAISDHRIISAEFMWGGIKPYQPLISEIINGKQKKKFKKRVDKDPVNNLIINSNGKEYSLVLIGDGPVEIFHKSKPDQACAGPKDLAIKSTPFAKNSKDIDIYFIPHRAKSEIEKKGGFSLTNVSRGGYKMVNKGSHGINIVPEEELLLLESGDYNLLVDINKDGHFDYGVDLVDNINEPSFSMVSCKDRKRPKCPWYDLQCQWKKIPIIPKEIISILLPDGIGTILEVSKVSAEIFGGFAEGGVEGVIEVVSQPEVWIEMIELTIKVIE